MTQGMKEKLVNAYRQGEISRRDAIKLLTATGFTAIAASAAIDVKAAETPKRGGRLRVGFSVGSSNDTLDPHKGASAMDHSMRQNMYNPLVSIGNDLRPAPELATSWDHNATVDQWTFELRKDVAFHDGRPLTSADAVYSVRRMVASETASPAAAVLSDVDPERVVADGKHRVTVGLTRPNADFPAIMGERYTGIVPDGQTEFGPEKAVGTGPFVIEDFQPGRRTLFRRNGAYWRDPMPYVDELENIPIPDQAARAGALATGEIDLLEGVDPSTIGVFEADPMIDLISTPSGAHRTMPMHADAAPYSDPRVRQALKLLVNRQHMIDVIHKGHAILANDHPISPMDPFYCTDLPQRGQDLDRAKFLLKEAGVLDLTFDLSTAPVITGFVECALLMREEAQKIGVNINVVREPVDSYWDAVWLKKPWCVSEWNMRPVPDMILSMVYSAGAPYNESHFNNERFDRLLVEARVTPDFDKRKELYCELQRLVHNEGASVIPYFINLLDAARSNVRGMKPNPTGPLGNWGMESIWLES